MRLWPASQKTTKPHSGERHLHICILCWGLCISSSSVTPCSVLSYPASNNSKAGDKVLLSVSFNDKRLWEIECWTLTMFGCGYHWSPFLFSSVLHSLVVSSMKGVDPKWPHTDKGFAHMAIYYFVLRAHAPWIQVNSRKDTEYTHSRTKMEKEHGCVNLPQRQFIVLLR